MNGGSTVLGSSQEVRKVRRMPTGCGYYDGEALGGVHMMVNRLNEVSVEEKERVETGPGVWTSS